MNDFSDDFSSLKLPPHSIEAEQSVLGGLMLNNEAWERISDITTEENFYRDDHRKIYRAISKLIEANKPADVLTVSEVLQLEQNLKGIGGLSYIQSLVEGTPSAANIRLYADIVRERAIMRSLARTGENIADSAYTSNGRTATELLGNAEAEILKISQTVQRERGGFSDIGETLAEFIGLIDERSKNPNALVGISTGFVDIDARTDGLQPSDLIIVAGRPSMGKTSLALNFVEHIAIVKKLPALVFSMEMSKMQLTARIVSSMARVEAHALKRGALQPQEWDRINGLLMKISDAPLHIDETPGLSHSEVRSRARRMHRKYGGIGVIVIDYLQLMRMEGNENRATQLGDVTRSLKAMAKELNCPVIALAQLNRELESREDNRPRMADLRESGAIEQDADLIIAIYRDEVYYQDEIGNKGIAEILTLKQRNGPIGRDLLLFRGNHTRFDNFVGDYAPRGSYSKQSKPGRQFGEGY